MRIHKTPFLFSIAIAVLSVSTQAQFRFGPEVGVNIGSISRELAGFSVSNSVRAGLRAGAIADVRIMDNLYFQPGVFYSMRGTKSTMDLFGLIKIEQTYSVNYVELPLNIQYKAGNVGEGRLFIGLGPYAGYVVGGKVITKVDQSLLQLLGGSGTGGLELPEEEQKLSVGTDSTDHVRPFDIGANVNLGYELPMGLIFRGQFGFGFLNTAPVHEISGQEVSQKNWTGSITIAYLIGLNRSGKKED